MKKKNVLRKRKGFTLIELIVVIAILGILAAIVAPRLLGFTETAKIAADDALMETANKALMLLDATDDLDYDEIDTLEKAITYLGTENMVETDAKFTYPGNYNYSDAVTDVQQGKAISRK